MERRRQADQKSAAAARRSQKSAAAAQAIYRRWRRGAIGAGLYSEPLVVSKAAGNAVWLANG